MEVFYFIPINLVILFGICTVSVKLQASGPVVTTNYGHVQGIVTAEISLGTSYQLTRFLGIPYAKPPINELRFMKPERIEPWNDTLLATEYGPSCYVIGNPSNATVDPNLRYVPQPYSQSEDCLHLNIYYGGDFNATSQNPSKSVMVFIHGGGYVAGNQNGFDGSVLSYEQDIIYVTMNFRVGFFGFASTVDGLIPGNMGLFDQHAALVWVQENIGAFGGDKTKVTIFGESAGGDSVFNHVMSPLSNGLFRSAIIESTGEFTKSLRAEQAAIFVNIAQSNWNCDTTSSVMLLQCLQELTTDQLNNPDQSDPLYRAFLGSAVTTDGEFLPDNPMTMMREGRFNQSVDIMIGYNGGDGDLQLNILSSFIPFPVPFASGIDSTVALGLVQSLLPSLLNSGEIKNQDIIMDIINREYFREANSQLEVVRRMIDLMTDGNFGTVAFEIASTIVSHGGSGNVYLYKFDYRSDTSFDNFNFNPQNATSNVELLAGHGDELYFNLGIAFNNGGEDEKISRAMMQCWADFSKSVEPKFTSDDTGNNVIWQPYTQSNQYMFHVQAPLSELSVKLVPQEIDDYIELWSTLLPEINNLSTSCHNPGDASTTPMTNGNIPTTTLEEEKRILNLSTRMTEILLIVCAAGLLFFLLAVLILHCCLINEYRKRK